MKNIANQWTCWWSLIQADWQAFMDVFVDRLINLCIWATTVIGVAGYILPIFGAVATYGSFTAVGAVVSAGVFDGYGRVAELVTELSDDKPILYQATLPFSSAALGLRIMISNTIRASVLSCFVLPLGRIILGSTLDFSGLRVVPFVGILLAATLFYGACSVWLACRVSSILSLSNVWMRFVFPFWFLGGFQFSQAALLQAFPLVGWLNFLNPMVYITEGMRAAVLGQQGFLNVWLCIGITILFWLFCAWRGIAGLKSRLDLI